MTRTLTNKWHRCAALLFVHRQQHSDYMRNLIDSRSAWHESLLVLFSFSLAFFSTWQNYALEQTENSVATLLLNQLLHLEWLKIDAHTNIWYFPAHLPTSTLICVHETGEVKAAIKNGENSAIMYAFLGVFLSPRLISSLLLFVQKKFSHWFIATVNFDSFSSGKTIKQNETEEAKRIEKICLSVARPLCSVTRVFTGKRTDIELVTSHTKRYSESTQSMFRIIGFVFARFSNWKLL